MKLLALLQARDNSKRLPNKATMDLNGKPMIQHVYDRLQKVGRLDGVVVSTSVESPEVVGYCKLNDIPHYVGSESDLLSRHLNAAVLYKADAILRITADCPFHDPELLDKMISCYMSATRCDALINWHRGQRSVSEGLDAAIVRVDTMHRLNKDGSCPREDWLTYLDTATRYRVMGCAWPERVGHNLHLSVDTDVDLSRARAMLEWLGSNDRHGYVDTLRAYEGTR